MPSVDNTDLADKLWDLSHAPGRLVQNAVNGWRQEPRVHVMLSAQVKRVEHPSVCDDDWLCTVHNISRGGIQFRCSEGTVDAMSLEQSDQAPMVKLRCDLPLTAGEGELSAVGKVVYITKIDGAIDRAKFAIGLAFQTFDNDGKVNLERYVEEQLKPSGYETECEGGDPANPVYIDW